MSAAYVQSPKVFGYKEGVDGVKEVHKFYRYSSDFNSGSRLASIVRLEQSKISQIFA